MEHVGIVVDDLAAAIEFFVELGLEPGGTGQVEGEWVDRIIALHETKAELAMLRTLDGDVGNRAGREDRLTEPVRRRLPRARAEPVNRVAFDQPRERSSPD